MKKVLLSLLALISLIGESMAEEKSPSEISAELRAMVLDLKPSDVGISRENFPYEVFAVVMETGYEEGFFTLSVIADGSTSLYFSNGGGIVGSGEHKNVREASTKLISGGNYFFENGLKTTEFPNPKSGQVNFYFITFDDVLIYQALEDDLGNNKDNLSGLFFAAHNVITELRNIQENGGEK